MSDTAYVPSLPSCQLCGGAPHPAAYDVSLAPMGDHRWANVCERVYQDMGAPRLGTGVGQRLIVGEKPKPDEVGRALQIRQAIEAGDFDTAEELIGDGDLAEWL